MTDKLSPADKILAGLTEALAHSRGEATGAKEHRVTLPQTDLEQRAREILREKLDLSEELLDDMDRDGNIALVARALVEALASSSVPEQNPRSFCAPGDRQHDAWLLRFDDQDMGDCIWTGDLWPNGEAERLAREAYERRSVTWNCYLFRLASPPPPEAPQDRGASQEDGRP